MAVLHVVKDSDEASVSISMFSIDQPRSGLLNPLTCIVEAESHGVRSHSAKNGNLKGEAMAETALTR